MSDCVGSLTQKMDTQIQPEPLREPLCGKTRCMKERERQKWMKRENKVGGEAITEER